MNVLELFAGIGGMTRNGTAYQLPRWARTTSVTGYSSWPTPTARLGDPKRGMPTPEHAAKRYATGRRNLDDAVRLWPTPTVKGNYNRRGSSARSGDGLATAAGGALNPTWVEWLMGFPVGWTDLEPSETPSSPRSPSTSDDSSPQQTRPPMRKPPPRPFRSGHCGLTNPPEIHRQCAGAYDGRTCGCRCHMPPKHCDTCRCEGHRP